MKLAGINIQIDTDSKYVIKKCHDYLFEFDRPDMIIKVSQEEIEKERSVNPGCSDDYYEYVCTYRSICLKMPLFNRLLMHSAVIEADERGYAFAAKSGVGKTTHILNWKKAFGDEVTVINGDKPIYSFEHGKIYAWGTPWCGKEGLNTNKSTEICAICLVKRSQENKIQKIEAKDAMNFIFNQILMPKSADAAIKTLELCSELLDKIPVYELYCTVSEDSARVARAMLDKV